MKMNMKKLLAVLLTAAMTVGIFAGCTAKDAENEVEKVEEEVKDEAEKLETEAEDEVKKLETEAEDEFEKLEGDAKEIIAAAKGKISEWAADVKEEVEGVEEVTEDDIHEAIDYIDEHIAKPFENGEVTKKLVKYAEKLKYMGEKDVELAEHEIAKLGQNVHDYLTKIIDEGEELESEAATKIKEDIDKGLETIKADKDKLVTEFHDLFKKKDE